MLFTEYWSQSHLAFHHGGREVRWSATRRCYIVVVSLIAQPKKRNLWIDRGLHAGTKTMGKNRRRIDDVVTT